MNHLYHQLKEICYRYHLDLLYVFGSRAQEVMEAIENNNFLDDKSSDIDIGVKESPGFRLGIEEKVKLTIALEDLFRANRVDLVTLNEADPFLAANIIRGERLYCQDGYQADEYELYILRRAGDLAPFERERLDLIFGGQDESAKDN